MKAKPSKSAPRTPRPVSIVSTNATAVDAADEVAVRAYSKYESSGYASGNDVRHWLEAESELATA